jgi:hypothetical protein
MLGSLCGVGDSKSVLRPLCAGGDGGPMLFGGVGDLGLAFRANVVESVVPCGNLM